MQCVDGVEGGLLKTLWFCFVVEWPDDTGHCVKLLVFKILAALTECSILDTMLLF